jgi:signal recognition particle receptor subunit beta
MPRLDRKTEQVVIRIVYDGPAWAGKTTTLRSLARALGSEIRSGEEADGRTLQFDWVDYVGGLFRGRPIQCQIVGVPGQRILESRRLAILRDADAVVFVADSRPSQREENERAFEGLRRATDGRTPLVATVIQANKRDLSEVLSLDEIRRQLRTDDTVAVTGSIAETGEGVRESFVLAVRLALDRVRSLWDGDGLPNAESPSRDADRLLESLADGVAEAAMEYPASSPAIASTSSGRTLVRGPKLPDDAVPPGLVWPPVAGRVLVHESVRQLPWLERSPRGDWIGRTSDWTLASPADALFLDFDAGRLSLVAWARWHVAAGARLASSRALVLAEAAPGAWRLWQIVKREPTLADQLVAAARSEDRRAGEQILRLIDVRLAAHQALTVSGWFPRLTLAEIASSPLGEPTFAGLADYDAAETDPADHALPDDLNAASEALIESEIAPALADALRSTPGRLAEILAGLTAAGGSPERRRRAAILRTALLRS